MRIYDIGGILYRLAVERNSTGIHELISNVGKKSKDTFYYNDNPKYYTDLVSKNPCVIGLDKGKIISSCCSQIGSEGPSDLYEAVGEIDIENSMVLKSCQVSEEYRGRGIGKTIIGVLLKEVLRSHPNMMDVYATVHPNNEASIKVLESVGFKKIAFSDTLYVGGPRNIYKLSIDEWRVIEDEKKGVACD